MPIPAGDEEMGDLDDLLARREKVNLQEFIDAQRRYFDTALELFGVERCMFESNFPVDKVSSSYDVLWNGFKKLAARYSESEQDSLLRGTASRVYRID